MREAYPDSGADAIPLFVSTRRGGTTAIPGLGPPESLLLRSQERDQSDQRGRLSLGAGAVLLLEEGLVRPVRAELGPRHEPSVDLVLAGQGVFLHVLRHAGREAVPVVEELEPRGERILLSDRVARRAREPPPLGGADP